MFNITIISGLSLSLMLITTIDPISVNAQSEENITDSQNTAIDFLSLQNAQSGSISKVNATFYELELDNISNKTILFSDRPDRIVESIPTTYFINNWST